MYVCVYIYIEGGGERDGRIGGLTEAVADLWESEVFDLGLYTVS